jgi:hypothetical protein
MSDSQPIPEFAPGMLVVCRDRFPHPDQWWIHEIHVGVVETVGTDPTEWNKSNSEEAYYQALEKQDGEKRVKVRYDFGTYPERARNLIVITPEQAALPFKEKIFFFMKEEIEQAQTERKER